MKKAVFYTAECFHLHDRLRKKVLFWYQYQLKSSGTRNFFKKGTEPYPRKSGFCQRKKVQLAFITGLNDYSRHRYLSASVPIGSNGNMTPGCASFLVQGLAIVGTMLWRIFEFHTTAHK